MPHCPATGAAKHAILATRPQRAACSRHSHKCRQRQASSSPIQHPRCFERILEEHGLLVEAHSDKSRASHFQDLPFRPKGSSTQYGRASMWKSAMSNRFFSSCTTKSALSSLAALRPLRPLRGAGVKEVQRETSRVKLFVLLRYYLLLLRLLLARQKTTLH